MGGTEVQAYPVSSKTLTIIGYLNGNKKGKEEKIVHKIVILREKNVKILGKNIAKIIFLNILYFDIVFM